MTEKKEKRYVSDNAQLMAEWDWEKNEVLDMHPSNLLSGSNKKAWWKCSREHSWQAVIATRSKGVGCPYCANRFVWKGFNDLATTHPHLINRWHPSKNEMCTPFDVTSGSDKIVWWLCECGNEWQARIANIARGQGCPICKRECIAKKISLVHLTKKGSLAYSNPELASEWHPTKNASLSPNDITSKSGRIVWWLGKCGHEWKASPSNRCSGTNCPYCSNQKVLYGFNDLSTLYPKITSEWHPFLNGNLKPKDVLGTSTKTVWWLGKCGHEWKQKISNRTVRNQGCSICAKRLQTSFPEQAIFYYVKKVFADAINGYDAIFTNQMELDIFIPSLKIGIEYDGVNWHGNSDSLRKEKEKYRICQSNGIKLIRVREQSKELPVDICDECVVLKRHPTPTELDKTILIVLEMLGKSVFVDTKNDAVHIRDAYINILVDDSLQKLKPDIAASWHPYRNGNLTPDMFTIHSGVKIWWLCSECGHEWEAAIATRTSGVGCKLCGYKKRATSRVENWIANKGSLADNNPSLAEEWHIKNNGTLTPYNVMQSSSKKVWWLGKCGHEWQATINSRASGNGCPECYKTRRKNGKV